MDASRYAQDPPLPAPPPGYRSEAFAEDLLEPPQRALPPQSRRLLRWAGQSAGNRAAGNGSHTSGGKGDAVLAHPRQAVPEAVGGGGGVGAWLRRGLGWQGA